MPKIQFALLTALLLSTVAAAQGLSLGKDPVLPPDSEEKQAVRAAILDYVEGVYTVDPGRIERSVHGELAKRGFYSREGTYHETPMTYEQLVKLAGEYNRDGRVPAGAPKEIEIFEVLDQTATAKLTAQWGIDYLHLAKYDGKWKIVNVLWQSTPAPPAAAERGDSIPAVSQPRSGPSAPSAVDTASGASGVAVLKRAFPGSPGAVDHGITEITLERTRCYGTCPAYSVTIREDGSLVYEGRAFVERKGKHTGEVRTAMFNRLARFVRDIGYQNLDERFAVPVADLPTCRTSVVMNGTRKQISNYGNAGPPSLWALEQLIDKMVAEASWDEVANKSSEKEGD